MNEEATTPPAPALTCLTATEQGQLLNFAAGGSGPPPVATDLPSMNRIGAVLLIVGLIHQERQATTLICRANYDVMRGLLDFLVAECCVETTCAPSTAKAG